MIVSVGGIRCYKLNGQLYSSASACLDFINDKGFLPDDVHLERGTRLHLWTTDSLSHRPLCLSDEEKAEYEEQVVPVLQWFKRMKVRVHAVETQICNEAYRLAGRADIDCTIANSRFIIDLKFAESIIERYHFQLHAYRMGDGYTGCRMGILQKPRNGGPKFVEVPFDHNKVILISSAANLLRWRIAKMPRDLTEQIDV